MNEICRHVKRINQGVFAGGARPGCGTIVVRGQVVPTHPVILPVLSYDMPCASRKACRPRVLCGASQGVGRHEAEGTEGARLRGTETVSMIRPVYVGISSLYCNKNS
jgi:hypothetical protein